MSDSAQIAQGEAHAFEELVLTRHLETARATEPLDNFVMNQQTSGKKSYGKSRVHSNIEESHAVVTDRNEVDSDDDVDLDVYVNNKSSKIIDNNQDDTPTDDYSYKISMNMAETQVDSLADASYNSEDDALANKTELDAILNSNENSNDSNITASSYQYMVTETQTSSVLLSQTSQGMIDDAVSILDSMKSPIKASSITKSLVDKVAAINMMSPNNVFNSNVKSPHPAGGKSPLASILSPSFLERNETSPADDLDKMYQNAVMDRSHLNLQSNIFDDAHGDDGDDLFNDDDSADDQIFNDPQAALAYSQEILQSQHMTLDGLEEDENSIIEGRSSNDSSYSSDAENDGFNQRVVKVKKTVADLERLELEKLMQKDNEELTEVDLEREKLYKFSEEDIENLIDRQKAITSVSLRSLGVARKDYKEQMQVLHDNSLWVIQNMRSDRWLYNELDKEFRDAKDEYNENDDGDVVVTKGYKGKFIHLRKHFYHITRESDELKKVEALELEFTEELEAESMFIDYVNEYNKSAEETKPIPVDVSMNTTTEDVVMLSDSDDDDDDEYMEEKQVVQEKSLSPLPPAQVILPASNNQQSLRLASGIRKTSLLDEKTKLRIKFMKSAKQSSLDKIKEQLRCGTDKQLQLKTIAFEKLRIIESIVNERRERVNERRNTRDEIEKELEHERMLKQRERAERRKRENLAGNIDEEGEFDENDEAFRPLTEEEQEKLRLEYERKILDGEYMNESEEEDEPEDDEEEIPDPVENEEDDQSVSSHDSNSSNDSKADGEEEPTEVETAPQYPMDDDLLDLDDDAENIAVTKNRTNKVTFKKGITSDDDEPSDPVAGVDEAMDDDDIDELDGGEADVADTADRNKKSKKKSNKVKNSSYIKAVKEEMERAKREKERKGFSSLLDDEVEDEDEDGVGKNGQRGLDEFGFIDTRLHKDQQAEEDATKIQIGDFDNIVDTLSDDEGDEDALEKFRLERDRLEDIAKQKALAEGRDALKRRKEDDEFNIAIGQDNTAEGEAADTIPVFDEVEDEGLDEEEMMQKGFETDKIKKILRQRKIKAGNYSEYDMLEDDFDDRMQKRLEMERLAKFYTGDDDDEEEEEEEEDGRRDDEELLTEEQIQERMQLRELERQKRMEKKRLWLDKNKQLKEAFDSKKKLKRYQSLSASQAPGASAPDSQSQSQSFKLALAKIDDDDDEEDNPLKRALSRSYSNTPRNSNPLQRSNSNVVGQPPQLQRSNSNTLGQPTPLQRVNSNSMGQPVPLQRVNSIPRQSVSMAPPAAPLQRVNSIPRNASSNTVVASSIGNTESQNDVPESTKADSEETQDESQQLTISALQPVSSIASAPSVLEKIKRRTKQVPKKSDLVQRSLSRQSAPVLQRSESLSHITTSLKTGITGPVKTNKYQPQADISNELDGGFGMGMATSTNTLFSQVTGKRSAGLSGGLANSSDPMFRAMSGNVGNNKSKRSKTNVTVASQQYVFSSNSILESSSNHGTALTDGSLGDTVLLDRTNSMNRSNSNKRTNLLGILNKRSNNENSQPLR